MPPSAPMTLADSGQIRLKRMYPAANYRATTATVQVPIPRVGDSMGAARLRDVELAQFVVDLLLALDGRSRGEVDLTTVPNAAD